MQQERINVLDVDRNDPEPQTGRARGCAGANLRLGGRCGAAQGTMPRSSYVPVLADAVGLRRPTQSLDVGSPEPQGTNVQPSQKINRTVPLLPCRPAH